MQIDKLSEQFSRDLSSKEGAVREIERSYQARVAEERSAREALEGEAREMLVQLERYKAQVRELEGRPAADNAELENVRGRNVELEGEVLKLQRIVNRECEERMELTEKLKELQSRKQQQLPPINPPSTGGQEPGNKSRNSSNGRNSNNGSNSVNQGRPTRPKGASRFSSWTQK